MRKLILYGSGEIGRKWIERLGSENVYAFADSDKKKIGKSIQGKKIVSVEELIQMKNEISIYISTSDTYKKEICQKLIEEGLNENIVNLPYKDVYVNQDANADMETIFEGRNALARGVRLRNCRIGYASYIASNTILKDTKIGKYSSIGPNIRIICGQHPTKDFVSTHPMFYSIQSQIAKTYVTSNLFDEYRYTENGFVAEIGNDVWVGDGVTIMEGVSIADGTIVAARTNLVKDTEPYSIVGGNPAKLIRYRFNEEEINFLKRLKWWDKSKTWIAKHAEYFSNVKELMLKVQKEEV